MARIAHIDADAFFYSVELQRDSSLRGKRVAVGGDSPRSVVSTASYEARKKGIHSGMSMQRAKVMAPDLVIVKPHFDAYREVSNQIWGIAESYLGPMEQAGLDEAYADLSRVEQPIALLKAMVEAVLDQSGIQLSVGLGPNRLVAKVASDADKPCGFLVLSREQACERFAGDSPGIIPGIGPKTQARLASLGIHTLEKLRNCPHAMLSGQFSSRSIQDLKARANFYGSENLQFSRTRKSRSAEETFAVDLTEIKDMEEEIALLGQRVGRDLKRREQAGATVGIKVKLADFTSYTRDRTIDHPTCDPEEITRIATELLYDSPPEGPVRLLGVRVGGLDRPESDLAVQLQLFR
jgi:DNA polymerase-4